MADGLLGTRGREGADASRHGEGQQVEEREAQGEGERGGPHTGEDQEGGREAGGSRVGGQWEGGQGQQVERDEEEGLALLAEWLIRCCWRCLGAIGSCVNGGRGVLVLRKGSNGDQISDF